MFESRGALSLLRNREITITIVDVQISINAHIEDGSHQKARDVAVLSMTNLMHARA